MEPIVIEYAYIYYILVGGWVGDGGNGGFRGGLCANQLIICSFYSHKKTWNNQALFVFYFCSNSSAFFKYTIVGYINLFSYTYHAILIGLQIVYEPACCFCFKIGIN